LPIIDKPPPHGVERLTRGGSADSLR